jgi:phosphatidylinositol alpha-1,6-mannosyltransferase
VSARTESRAVVLTPGMVGADGISELSRMVVRALTSSMTLDVVSLSDNPRGLGDVHASPRVRVSGAGGRKFYWVGAALRAALTGARPAHVVCLHLHLSGLGWLVAAARRSGLAVFLIGIEAWKPLTLVQRWALGHADVLIAISDHTARRFREANPDLATRPVRICHPGLREQNAEGNSRVDEPGPFALIVGRMAADERYKGHDLLLDIWPRVMAEVPQARLVVTGDGDDRARLQARAATLGDRVRVTGPVGAGALATLYRQCAFFVMPSRDEGFGLVYLEAMRAGKACIGGVGAATEVIEDGVTGIVVNPGEPEEVLEAMLRLFREPETRDRMGRAGSIRVAREFTEAQFGCRLRDLFGLPEDAA